MGWDRKCADSLSPSYGAKFFLTFQHDCSIKCVLMTQLPLLVLRQCVLSINVRPQMQGKRRTSINLSLVDKISQLSVSTKSIFGRKDKWFQKSIYFIINKLLLHVVKLLTLYGTTCKEHTSQAGLQQCQPKTYEYD